MVAVGFGIKKLQINLVIEDDKIGLDDLQQQIEEDEDHVQSTDVSFRTFPPPPPPLSFLAMLLTRCGKFRSPLCRSCRVGAGERKKKKHIYDFLEVALAGLNGLFISLKA